MLSAYLAQGEQTPELDESMEVTESNVHGNKDDVRRIADVVAPEFHGLAEQKRPAKHEHEQ